MWVARKAFGRFVSAVGVSIFGAVASNAVQMVIASVLVFGDAASGSSRPPFLATGLITGALLGVFAELFARKSRWYARARGRESMDRARRAAARKRRCGASAPEFLLPAALAAGGSGDIGGLPLPALARNSRASCSCSSWSRPGFRERKSRSLATIVVSAGIVAANLLVPVGKVVAILGPFKITQTALFDGVGKALVFEGLVYISKASILPGLRLPGRFGALVAYGFRLLRPDSRVRGRGTSRDPDRGRGWLMLKMWETPQPEHGARESRDRSTRRRPRLSGGRRARLLRSYWVNESLKRLSGAGRYSPACP